MGIDRSYVQGLAQFDPKDLNITVYVLHAAGRLMDFHTVGGGYDRVAEEQFIVHTAEGKLKAPGKETVTTQREYLQDAKFGVVLQGDTALLGRIADALQNPRWGIWLGRKACIPASLVFQGVHDSEALALQRLQERASPGCGVRSIIREVDRFEDGTDTLMDTPLDFAKRDFIPRRVSVESPGGE
jgi:CRISPR system Cascade subunit CasD